MNRDFKELLQCLNQCRVKYLIVGGYATIEYTEPKYTKDLDLWVEPTEINAEKLIKALDDFGAPLFGATPAYFTTPGNVLQIGVAPIRIDLLTSISGVDFSSAWENRIEIDFEGVSAAIISLEDLIKNKRATGRPQDLDEVLLLEQVLAQKERGR